MFSQFFKKLSLTQQVLLMILLFISFFATFFFFYLSNNIDNMIANQMYTTMSSRQQPIVSLLKSNLLGAGDAYDAIYKALSSDNIQTNCIVSKDSKSNEMQITILNPDNAGNVDQSLYHYLIDQSSAMVAKDDEDMQGMISNQGIQYYYRLQQVQTANGVIVLVSFMDDAYPQSIRNTLVESTVYGTILAFCIFIIIMMIWVFSIIHPLNQIKSYIAQVKQGKEVELHLNRDDEIGEVAKELVNMKDELQKQEKVKEEMIHNISHDLKTPIATIKSYSESIKDGVYPYGTLEKSIDVILDNANRLEAKVHNLLYLNRIEYLITSDAEGVVTNMKEVVEEVVLNSAVIRPEIRIITDVEEVFFDGLLESWRVCIENIMENAFRYAKSYIQITVRENDLQISNDGPKMPEDRIDALFRPYEKGEGGRFGLGLSIVSRVVKANKYHVKGFNTEDGVCFRIYRDVPKPKKKPNDRKSWCDNKAHENKKEQESKDNKEDLT
ncbi:HAMP domain-containing sensor histidine kinase [uncultured Faecalicoccus sp.]|uniref:HAMP domain-containing sensor histidine kinase n=1 Tax=uncultured Faecalicoccus sp. TaxID=1971760 RepID=UPI002586E2CA|nr:HAMP domain-containing sensor histidine kinase [uncultured Faecalicoccus sp.]